MSIECSLNLFVKTFQWRAILNTQGSWKPSFLWAGALVFFSPFQVKRKKKVSALDPKENISSCMKKTAHAYLWWVVTSNTLASQRTLWRRISAREQQWAGYSLRTSDPGTVDDPIAVCDLAYTLLSHRGWISCPEPKSSSRVHQQTQAWEATYQVKCYPS